MLEITRYIIMFCQLPSRWPFSATLRLWCFISRKCRKSTKIFAAILPLFHCPVFGQKCGSQSTFLFLVQMGIYTHLFLLFLHLIKFCNLDPSCKIKCLRFKHSLKTLQSPVGTLYVLLQVNIPNFLSLAPALWISLNPCVVHRWSSEVLDKKKKRAFCKFNSWTAAERMGIV